MGSVTRVPDMLCFWRFMKKKNLFIYSRFICAFLRFYFYCWLLYYCLLHARCHTCWPQHTKRGRIDSLSYVPGALNAGGALLRNSLRRVDMVGVACKTRVCAFLCPLFQNPIVLHPVTPPRPCPWSCPNWKPPGGVFEYVSAANFFGECVEWCGWATFFFLPAEVLFLAFTAAAAAARISIIPPLF